MMKFIISFPLFTVFCLIQWPIDKTASLYFSKDHVYRCENFKLKTLAIKDNPFVKPGKRVNNDVWYQSVNWTRIPPGQVMVTTDITIHEYGRPSKVKGRDPAFDLFLPDLRDTDGSFANIMRMALGIPRFSNPVLGERKLDPQMFSAKPCTVFYLNVFPYYTIHQYTYEFTVTAKEGGKSHKIITGTLIKPDE